MPNSTEIKWLLLAHQIPPKPDYFRVKMWRRLQQIGAVAIKQAVYVMPRTEQSLEDLSWVRKEIAEAGGDAFISEVLFVDGLTDVQVKAMFQAARDKDYQKIADEVQALVKGLSKKSFRDKESLAKIRAKFSRLKQRFEHVAAMDFFGATGRGAAEGALADVSSRLMGTEQVSEKKMKSLREMTGRTWVTRADIFADRAACAWLIRKFIDGKARFRFVSAKNYRPKGNEVRFDMFDAEFTHVGDRCSFEVMVGHFAPDDYALSQIAEIIHDIDLKDEKFARREADGIRTLFEGITASRAKDEDRLERGSMILDELYEFFRRQ
ncbi:MAG: chromate resistance protein ChrB domain-containing protein [bacterium]